MNNKPLIELWGDTLNPLTLVKTIVFISGTTMGAHLLAPSDNETMGLFFGLGGAVVSFAIATSLIKPKRNVSERRES